MVKTIRLVALALLCSSLYVGGGSAQAAVTTGGHHVGRATGASSSPNAERRKHRKHKKHKKHKKQGASSRCWPGATTLTGARPVGAVQFRWGYTSCTTRYRVRISPAWFGEWPGAPTYTPWVSGSSRSVTFRVATSPHPGDGMMAVAYANPVFGQLEANNALHKKKVATHKSTWIPVWPWAPAPAAGDGIRFGTYNVMLYPTGARATAAAANIGSHGLSMVALQEARQSTASDIVGALNSMYPGSDWTYVQANGADNYTPGQQIIYRSSVYSLADSGVFDLANPRDSKAPAVGPYAGFQVREANGALGPVFHVASVHYSGSSGSSLAQNASTGGAAQVTANFLKRLSGPVIVAGDMRYGREPWGDRPGYVPAQPTFIRNGYYDAMASQSMHGQNYANVNSINGKPTARQQPNRTGLGTRSDHILLRGFRGSRLYSNVVNFSYRGVVPSDHNLVYSDLNIPR
jgi:hypothetical protein